MTTDVVCRDLAVVLWNLFALEILSVAELEYLKRGLLGGLCEVVSRKGAMDATDEDHLDTCNLIKGIAQMCIQTYSMECSRLTGDIAGENCSVSACPPQLSLIKEFTKILDSFLSCDISKGLEYFVEPMLCPRARICLERQDCVLQLRTGTLLFRYFVRHMGKSAYKYHDLLGPFILTFLAREDYKDCRFRLAYSYVVDLMVSILEFGKDMFVESSTILPYCDAG